MLKRYEIVGIRTERKLAAVIAVIHCRDIDQAIEEGKDIIRVRHGWWKPEDRYDEYWVCRGMFDNLHVEEVNLNTDQARRIK